eukprot:1882453-Rhodomonas_salina.1
MRAQVSKNAFNKAAARECICVWSKDESQRVGQISCTEEVVADACDGVMCWAVYVMYGKLDGFAAELMVSSLDGSDGFRIVGPEREVRWWW